MSQQGPDEEIVVVEVIEVEAFPQEPTRIQEILGILVEQVQEYVTDTDADLLRLKSQILDIEKTILLIQQRTIKLGNEADQITRGGGLHNNPPPGGGGKGGNTPNGNT